jgi:uncharacterized RDD family membrane protein YckC
MNIEKKYATSIRRATATGIDLWLVLFLRIFFMQLLGFLWINASMAKFMREFNENFGTESVKNTPEHIDFIIHHSIFVQMLIFYALVIIVGALYHAYLNSSAWQGTLGKRFMKIRITKEDGAPITLNRGFAHYFLSVLPFAFILYLITFQLKNKLTFFQAVTASEANVFFGIVFLLWIQIHLFTRKKNTAYDMICHTILVSGKTAAKFPWSK